MAAANVGGGGVPIVPIVVGGVVLITHKHEGLSKEVREQIEQGNQFVVDLAEALAEASGESIGFTGLSINELGQHLQNITGLTLQELGEFLGVLPPRVSEGAPILVTEAADLHAELELLTDFIGPAAFPLPDLLQKLSQLLLNPSRVPGAPCPAPAPLLRDLLDIALGQFQGVIGETLGKVGDSIQDLLLPAFATGNNLTHFIQAILDDPVTAALNLVLGQRAQIDCVVDGSLGVGEIVLDTGLRHIKEAIRGALS